MKKKGLAIVSVLIVFLFIISLVVPASAYFFVDLRQGSYDIINWIVDISEPFLQVLFGGGYYTGFLLFERFLIFLITASIVYIAISKISIFEEKKGVLWIITIAVPLIGIRFMNFEWINTILVQYQILTIVLAAGLPFIIYFFFLHNIFSENAALRKIGWVFFAVVYLGLWSTSEVESYSEIYFWTAIAAFLFLLLDGTISRHRESQKFKKIEKEPIIEKYLEISKSLEDVEGRYGGKPEKDIPKDILRYWKELKKEQKRLKKEMNS